MIENGLPKGWALAKIGDVTFADVEQIKVHGDGVFTYVDIGAVDNISKKIIEPKELSCAEAPSRARQVLKPGDVLVSMTRPNLNAVAMLPGKLANAIGSTGFHILRSKEVKPSFLYYLIQSDRFVQAICQLVLGVLYPAVRPRDINSFEFGLPPASEQKRIVAEIETLLTQLDAGVAALKRVQANLKRYRASVLKAACEGRLVPTEAELARNEGRSYESGEQLLQRILKERRAKWESDQLAKMLAAGKPPQNDDWKKKYKEPAPPYTTNLPELPEGWTWASSDQLLTFVTSGSRGWARYYSSTGALFLRMTNLNHGTIALDLCDLQHVEPPEGSEGERTRVLPHDILLSITADVGMVAVVPEGIGKAFINQHVGLCRPGSCLSSRYLGWYFASPAGQDQLHELQRGATKLGLGLDDLRAVAVPLPPAGEQGRIVSAIERSTSTCDEVEAAISNQLVRADRLRQSILKRAFEGKLVPQDPNDESASVLLERIRAERANEQTAIQPIRGPRTRKSKGATA